MYFSSTISWRRWTEVPLFCWGWPFLCFFPSSWKHHVWVVWIGWEAFHKWIKVGRTMTKISLKWCHILHYVLMLPIENLTYIQKLINQEPTNYYYYFFLGWWWIAGSIPGVSIGSCLPHHDGGQVKYKWDSVQLLLGNHPFPFCLFLRNIKHWLPEFDGTRVKNLGVFIGTAFHNLGLLEALLRP